MKKILALIMMVALASIMATQITYASGGEPAQATYELLIDIRTYNENDYYIENIAEIEEYINEHGYDLGSDIAIDVEPMMQFDNATTIYFHKGSSYLNTQAYEIHFGANYTFLIDIYSYYDGTQYYPSYTSHDANYINKDFNPFTAVVPLGHTVFDPVLTKVDYKTWAIDITADQTSNDSNHVFEGSWILDLTNHKVHDLIVYQVSSSGDKQLMEIETSEGFNTNVTEVNFSFEPGYINISFSGLDGAYTTWISVDTLDVASIQIINPNSIGGWTLNEDGNYYFVHHESTYFWDLNMQTFTNQYGFDPYRVYTIKAPDGYKLEQFNFDAGVWTNLARYDGTKFVRNEVTFKLETKTGNALGTEYNVAFFIKDEKGELQELEMMHYFDLEPMADGTLINGIESVVGHQMQSFFIRAVPYETVKVFYSNGQVDEYLKMSTINQFVPTAPEPSISGKTVVFGGWYLDPEFTESFDLGTPLESNIHLYARFYEIDSQTNLDGNNNNNNNGNNQDTDDKQLLNDDVLFKLGEFEVTSRIIIYALLGVIVLIIIFRRRK